MNDVSSTFWDFSLRFYAEPGVAAACLELQDHGGADINVVLYLFFLATQRRMLNRDQVAQIDGTVAAWREQVVQPLRSVRRQLKAIASPFAGDAASRLRDDTKRSELAAERIQQHTIEQQFPSVTFGMAAASPEQAVRASLDAYSAHVGALPADAVNRMIASFCQQYK